MALFSGDAMWISWSYLLLVVQEVLFKNKTPGKRSETVCPVFVDIKIHQGCNEDIMKYHGDLTTLSMRVD